MSITIKQLLNRINSRSRVFKQVEKFIILLNAQYLKPVLLNLDKNDIIEDEKEIEQNLLWISNFPAILDLVSSRMEATNQITQQLNMIIEKLQQVCLDKDLKQMETIASQIQQEK